MHPPDMFRARVKFAGERLSDPAAALRTELDASGATLRPGARVAIAVGSRGLANLVALVRTTVAWVKEQGAEPFLVPCMGSHGGATAEGQRSILLDYGLTPETVGAEIRSSMEVVALPQDGLPIKVYFDRQAYEADATIVLNRIKPHTAFHGDYESGLAKMLCIGLGKHQQALTLHHLGPAAMREYIPLAAARVLRYANVLLGIAVVENGYDETMLIKAIPNARFLAEEPPLLAQAKAVMPSLPVDDLDLLIVDEMGKDISGTGLDVNIIGRMKLLGQPEPDRPRIRIIYVRGLTEGSHGNANGMGLADLISRRLFEQTRLKDTYANIITTGFLDRGKIPVIAETDDEAIEYTLQCLGLDDLKEARIIRIKNTLKLDDILISEAVRKEIEGRKEVAIEGPAELF